MRQNLLSVIFMGYRSGKREADFIVVSGEYSKCQKR